MHGGRLQARDLSMIGRVVVGAVALLSVAACGDDGRAPVSPVPPVREAGTRDGTFPDEDLGTPPPEEDTGVPIADMGVPIDDLGSPIDLGPGVDAFVPPPLDMGGPMDTGPRDSGPTPDASIGPLTRAILRHSCDPFDGRPTLLLELSGSVPGTCDPSMDETIALTVINRLPIEPPDTLEGDMFVTGALCFPDGAGGFGCSSGTARLTFDTYEDNVAATGSFTLTVGANTYEDDFDATFCERVDVCGG